LVHGSVFILKYLPFAHTTSEVVAMPKCSGGLRQLLNQSQSTRAYFLSLPASMQVQLHAYNDHIGTAFDLRRYAEHLERLGRI